MGARQGDLLDLFMASFVVHHVALRAETHTALRAAIGLRILVDQFVNPKVLDFGEALVTETTAEGMHAVVNVHVCLEPVVALESLAAARILADILLSRLASSLHFQGDSALASWTWALKWSLYLAGVCESPLFKHPLVHTSVLPGSWRRRH